jgi:drug/metabolite transporter (DMT)-like permease
LKKAFLYIALATFFFSTMEIALKLCAGSFNSIQLTFLRFLIGGIVLLPLAIRETKRKKTAFHRGDWAFLALTGFICVVVSMVLFQMGVVYSPASIVAVLFSCNSVFVVLFAFLILGERIHRHTAISVVVCLLGMVILIDPLHFSGSAAGIVLSLGSAVTFALYNVIGRLRSEKYGGITLTCLSFLCGCAEMLILIAVSHIPTVAHWCGSNGLSLFVNIPIANGISLGTLPGLIYLGVFITGLGYTFYFLAMEKTSAATASLVFYIKPVLAPLLAMAILGETITLPMTVGIVLIIISSLIAFIPGIRLRKGQDLKEDVRELETEFEAETDETTIKP